MNTLVILNEAGKPYLLTCITLGFFAFLVLYFYVGELQEKWRKREVEYNRLYNHIRDFLLKAKDCQIDYDYADRKIRELHDLPYKNREKFAVIKATFLRTFPEEWNRRDIAKKKSELIKHAEKNLKKTA